MVFSMTAGKSESFPDAWKRLLCISLLVKRNLNTKLHRAVESVGGKTVEYDQASYSTVLPLTLSTAQQQHLNISYNVKHLSETKKFFKELPNHTYTCTAHTLYLNN